MTDQALGSLWDEVVLLPYEEDPEDRRLRIEQERRSELLVPWQVAAALNKSLSWVQHHDFVADGLTNYPVGRTPRFMRGDLEDAARQGKFRRKSPQ